MLNHQLQTRTSPLWPKVLLLALMAAGTAGFDSRLAAGDDEPANVLVKGRIVSREYKALGGGIERSIVFAYKLPQINRVMKNYSDGGPFEFELPPGRYSLQFSANGTRGATFRQVRKEIVLPSNKKVVDVGEIDLAATTTTKLYGKTAPELDGIVEWKHSQPQTLKQLRGKVVVLDFWAYYCTICHAHKPDLAKLYDKYRNKGLEVIAVHNNSLLTMQAVDEHMTKFSSYQKLHLPIALDGKGAKSVCTAYGITGVPAVILVDRNGKIVRRFHHAGKPELEKEIVRLLAQSVSATGDLKPETRIEIALARLKENRETKDGAGPKTDYALPKTSQVNGDWGSVTGRAVSKEPETNEKVVTIPDQTLTIRQIPRIRLKDRPPRWSDIRSAEDIKARLTIDDDGTRTVNGVKLAYAVIEVHNSYGRSMAPIDIRFSDKKGSELQVLDAAGNFVEKYGMAFRRLPYFPRSGTIPFNGYLGLPTYGGGISEGSADQATFIAWRHAWHLYPGTYTLQGTLELSVREDIPNKETPWKDVSLKLAPIEFIVPNVSN